MLFQFAIFQAHALKLNFIYYWNLVWRIQWGTQSTEDNLNMFNRVLIYKLYLGQLLFYVHCLTKAVPEISTQQRDNNKNIDASQGKPFAPTKHMLGKLHGKDFLPHMCFKALYMCTFPCSTPEEGSRQWAYLKTLNWSEGARVKVCQVMRFYTCCRDKSWAFTLATETC